MSCVFTEFRVYPKQSAGHLVTWTVDGSISNPSFQLQSSRVPDSDDSYWVNVGTASTGTTTIINDSSTQINTIRDRLYYRVRAEDLDNPGTYVYSRIEPVWGSLDRNDQLFFREIVRRENLRMRKKSGIRGVLLYRRWWGTDDDATDINNSVKDPITGDVLNPYSTVTYGTDIDEGFYDPLLYYVDPIGLSPIVLPQATGTIEQSTLVVKGVNYPEPRPRDIWIDCTSGKRYFVAKVEHESMIRHLPVILRITMNEIQPGEIEYEVPIDG